MDRAESDEYFSVLKSLLNSNSEIPATSIRKQTPLEMECSFRSNPQKNAIQCEPAPFQLAEPRPHMQPKWINQRSGEDPPGAILQSSVQTSSAPRIPRSQCGEKKKSGNINTRYMYELTPKEKHEVVDLFDNGHSCSHIMQKTNLSVYSVKQILGAAGRAVIFRKWDQDRYNALRPVILELSKQGWSPRAITKRVKTSRLWVDKILKDAGPSETPPVRTSRSPKRMNPWMGRPRDPAFQDVHMSDSAGESSSTNRILLDDRDRQCQYMRDTLEDTEISKEVTSIAEEATIDRNALGDHKTTDIPEICLKTDVPTEQHFSAQRKPQRKTMEYCSISADECAEIHSKIPLLPPENAYVDGPSGRYQCQICRLSWEKEEPFLLHLANREHEEICATGIFLYCTGCKFRTRKPATMGKHIIKYQSQTTPPNCSMHSVKMSTDNC
ncbi:uncharacterized protein LOC129592312 [Paramacrobiotus metropolitanus]|uniref:uncharacterized protein LOC129592312 n=1 Tax=Paramacrobiotus metropolitanus TaxID=2943436 RepID=UPI00244610F2|nr:uncharacterized protein LOC129592312 [Paramacrobiotus metropolitanus]XP_055344299.1 uncharacterized protein LOC129592312 [Paramacrobiotus metropolitanus]XP_055344300.1 uncharacterized protein LOC129592312 [Paramacrobiotus metropolitanus]